ncbi:MAG: hypothetical protein NXI19_20990 [Alphaproteobacteria bacterium]|nr:hypothetical protein [Alphaproteobacteria bacterium]
MTRLLPWKTCLQPDWPDADRHALAAAREGGGFFEIGGALADTPADQLKRKIQGWGNWLGYLVHEGIEVANVGGSGLDAITRDQLGAYIEVMQQHLRPISVRNYIQALFTMARALYPEADHTVLSAVNASVNRHTALSSRQRKPLIDAGTLHDLSRDLMGDLFEGTTTPLQDIARFRDGLAIGMLLHAPARVGNFAHIRIGRDLHKIGDRYRIDVPKEQVKNRQALSYWLGGWLTPFIDRYIEEIRPALAVRKGRWARDGAQDWFWLSESGGPLDATHLSRRVACRIEAITGVRLTAHQFRSVAATTIALEDPEHVGMIRATLGHGSMRTSEVHYNMAGSASAAISYHAVLTALKKG